MIQSGRRGLLLVAGVVLVIGIQRCAYEASFKPVTFSGVDYDRVFQSVHALIVRHYQGLVIRSNAEEGRIETDPVEFATSKGTRQERVFVKLDRLGEDQVRVELFAPLYRLIVDPDDAEAPMRWEAIGSDATQERLMLEELIGAVLRDFPGAEVIQL